MVLQVLKSGPEKCEHLPELPGNYSVIRHDAAALIVTSATHLVGPLRAAGGVFLKRGQTKSLAGFSMGIDENMDPTGVPASWALGGWETPQSCGSGSAKGPSWGSRGGLAGEGWRILCSSVEKAAICGHPL